MLSYIFCLFIQILMIILYKSNTIIFIYLIINYITYISYIIYIILIQLYHIAIIKIMENIYITWHYTTHGIAYLKHILAAFYNRTCSPKQQTINATDIDQYQMNAVFDSPIKDGFVFDAVYYLTAPQAVFNAISMSGIEHRKRVLRFKELEKSGTLDLWEDIIQKELIHKENEGLASEMAYVEKNYPDKYEMYKQQIWLDIQHYPISEQIKWLMQHSNAAPFYQNKLNVVNMEVNDLRNPINIADKVSNFLQKIHKKHPNAQLIINAVLGSNETQVVWHVLSENNRIPKPYKLLRTYDKKDSNPPNQYMRFDIVEIPITLLSDISNNLKVYDSPKSDITKNVNIKMTHYLKAGFSILLLGERGVGKSHLAEKYKGEKNFEQLNCAMFTDNYLSESLLFGHKKGAFTGADRDEIGYFVRANNGILFFDEFHHLNKYMQAKLMKAIQTNEKNEFTITPLGGERIYVKAGLIFASNKTIEELREIMLPDFYDRVTQLVIELPALRESNVEIEEFFKQVWIDNMKFDLFFKYNDYPGKDIKLINWLKSLDLYGNFRDLQKIAIYYKTYLAMKDDAKNLGFSSAFEFAKNEFEKYFSPKDNHNMANTYFDESLPLAKIKSHFFRDLAIWAINRFSSAEKAALHFRNKDQSEKITKETLYRWKNNEG